MTTRASSDRWISPLRYPGGKARMTPWLVEHFDTVPSFMDVEIWVEPFAGGAGAALTALVHHDVPEAWLIEQNPALAAFWRTVLTDGHRLAERVTRTVPDLTLFTGSRELVGAALAGEQVPDTDLAFATFVLNRCSRSGLLNPNVGPIGGKHQSGRYTVASRWNGPALADRITLVADLGAAGRVQLLDGDGIGHVEQLDGTVGIEEEMFLFVDPPYIGVGNALYAHGMTEADHARLAAALRQTPASWVLTYDAHPLVLDLYPGHGAAEFEIPHTANKAKVGTEYVLASRGLSLGGANPMGKGSVRQAA